MPRHSYNFDAPRLTSFLHLWSNGLYALILATSVMGMCFIAWRPIGWAHCFLLFIIYNLGLFLFLHVKTRYIVQFMPMMMFFSGITAHWISLLIRKQPNSSPPGFVVSRPRVILGAVLAFAIEFLAFRSAIVAHLP